MHTRISDVSARLQNLRNLLNSERHTAAEQRRAIEAFDHEVANMTMEQRSAIQQHGDTLQRLNTVNERGMREVERRRPYIEALLSEDTDTSRLPPPAPSGLSPSNLVRTRRRAFRPSERLTRSMRDRLTSSGEAIIPSPTYSTPPPRPSSPRPIPESAVREYAESAYGRDTRNRAKRRKLDDGSYEDETRAITYGQKGQVVPGQLRLDIASCDGGEYSDPHVPVSSWPQNVLQDDATVYCTKSNRCNMLFKHTSGMPFTLTKMIIKAPRSGYDAPIQEGMIFVAMDDESLVEKTAKYEIHYSPKSYRYHRQRFDSRPSQDWSNSTRSPLRSIDRSRYLRDPAPHYSHVQNDPVLESAVVPGFAVSTGEPSDDEDALPHSGPSSPRPWHDPDADYSYRAYADRYRPVYNDDDGRAPRYDYDISAPSSDSEAEESSLLEDLLRTRRRSRDRSSDVLPVMEYARRMAAEENSNVNRRSTPSRIGLRSHGAIGAPDPMNPSGYERLSSAEPESSTSKAREEAMQEARRVSGEGGHEGTLAPHARFFIPRHRSSVAVKFDPPV